MHIVHIITHPGDLRAWETAASQAADHRVTVVLLQDAVLDPPVQPVAPQGALEVRAGARDLEAYGLAGRHRALADDDLIALLFAADRVISW